MNRTTSFRALVVTFAAALGACRSAPPIEDAAPPELQLLQSGPMTLIEGCTAPGSYFVAFTVDNTGRVQDIALPVAPECVRNALTAWVSSFRYAPPAAPTPAGVEWVLVRASRTPS